MNCFVIKSMDFLVDSMYSESFVISKFAVLQPLIPLVGYRAVLALSGYLLSNISFVFAALFLYR